MKASEIAKYIIAYNDSYGDLITNKKLQKLLYYIKAWGLVYFKDGIIDDDFVAWVHGPVCVKVYNEYKSFGFSPLKNDYSEYSDKDIINIFQQSHKDDDLFHEKVELINAVLLKYGPFSSMQLELLSHSEEPWQEARKGLQPIEKGNIIIKKETISRYYKKLIDAEN